MIATDLDKDIADQIEGLFQHEGWKKLEARAREKIRDLESKICRGDLEPADYAKACGEIKGINHVLETLPGILLNAGGKRRPVKE